MSGIVWTGPKCSVTYFDSDSFLFVQCTLNSPPILVSVVNVVVYIDTS